MKLFVSILGDENEIVAIFCNLLFRMETEILLTSFAKILSELSNFSTRYINILMTRVGRKPFIDLKGRDKIHHYFKFASTHNDLFYHILERWRYIDVKFAMQLFEHAFWMNCEVNLSILFCYLNTEVLCQMACQFENSEIL